VLHHRGVCRQCAVDGQVSIAIHIQRIYSIAQRLAFAFFGAEQVQLIQTELQTRPPAGADIAAYVLTALLWPATLFGVDMCVV
jgi:hypothetical protein